MHVHCHGFHIEQEAVADTLEQLWISYNFIEKLKGITVLGKLKASGQKVTRSWGYVPLNVHGQTVSGRYCTLPTTT